MAAQKHIWNFSMVGGVKRVHLVSGEDLLHLHELDQKLWTALSCPVNGLEIDAKTLSLIDTNGDDQIRVPEILDAVTWITSVLKNPDLLLQNGSNFELDFINTETAEGQNLYASAKTILRNLGKPNTTYLTVADTNDIDAIFSASPFNGDGVITEDSTNDEAILDTLNTIMACTGSSKDRGGKSGVDSTQVNSFFEACDKYLNWINEAQQHAQTILPMGEKTAIAFETFNKVASKVNDYFLRCQLAAFNNQTTAVLNLANERVQLISDQNLTGCLNEIATYPLAEVIADKPLPIVHGINPAWVNEMQTFKTFVVDTLMPNQTVLTESNWRTIENTFVAYQNWLALKPGSLVDELGADKINHIIKSQHQSKINQLIEQDLALANEANNIILVDKMVRYHRDIFTLLNNFVTFYDFYTPGKKAIFQAGTLYIDQRSCNLCIKVNDMEKHKTMANLSGMFLIYCECTAQHSTEKITIVAALTNGDIDNLVEGRNAVFYDIEGNDWDATVVRIIDNPISIRQAFWSPYRKVSRFVEKQINKVASDQDSKVTTDATQKIEEFPTKAVTENKPPAQPFDVGKFVGIFAAISLALGAIGTAIASFVSGFIALTWWKMPLAMAGILLLISGPSMVMAYLKLRKRNLAPLLDANGWAINAGAVINIQFGNMLTHLADLPFGAKVNLNDPFTKKQRPILPYFIGIALLIGVVFYLLWKNGLIHIR